MSAYWNQPWADQRTSALFGIFPGNPMYQNISRMLVNDWGSVFTPFVCSSLFCNNKGYCSIGPMNNTNNTNSTNSNVTNKTPVCSCINGWKGKRCVFPATDYHYGLNWTNGIDYWLSNAIKNVSLNMNDTNTFVQLANIAGLLPQFTSFAESSDVSAVTSTMQNVMNTLYSMSVNFSDPIIQQSVVSFVNNLTQVNDTLLGVNPVDVINRFGAMNGTNASNFIYYAIPANLTGDSRLALPTGGISRRLYRFLQQAMNVFNLNSASSPVVTIPMNISQSINNTVNGSQISYSLAAIKDPKPMMNSVENYIHSQIIGERAYLKSDTKNGFNFSNLNNNLSNNSNNSNNTNNATYLTVKLPWAYTPMNLKEGANYLNNCKVYKYDNGNFVPTNTCVLLNTTDQNYAMLNCLNLDVIGVGCVNSSNVFFQTTNNNGNNVGNNNSSGRTSLATYFLAVLLLFVL